MQVIGGYCWKCGAPFYVPDAWGGINPPQATPTCGCWNVPQSIISDNANGFLKDE
jgi:hypothetical protein